MTMKNIVLILIAATSFSLASDMIKCSSVDNCLFRAEVEFQKKDYSKYIKYMEQACYRFKDCYYLGTVYLKGEVVEQNYQKAVELMKSSCKPDRVVPCETIARMYQKGDKYLKPNPNEAQKYLDVTKPYYEYLNKTKEVRESLSKIAPKD